MISFHSITRFFLVASSLTLSSPVIAAETDIAGTWKHTGPRFKEVWTFSFQAGAWKCQGKYFEADKEVGSCHGDKFEFANGTLAFTRIWDKKPAPDLGNNSKCTFFVAGGEGQIVVAPGKPTNRKAMVRVDKPATPTAKPPVVATTPTPVPTPKPSVPTPAPKAPVIAWTDDLNKMKPPDTPAAGKIAGRDFKPTRITYNASGRNLTFDQTSTDALPDLRLVLEMRNVAVKGKVPEGQTIINGPKAAVTTKDCMGAMYVRAVPGKGIADPTPFTKVGVVVEFGQRTGNKRPGKIFYVLPDKDKSFLAGSFEAAIAFEGKLK